MYNRTQPKIQSPQHPIHRLCRSMGEITIVNITSGETHHVWATPLHTSPLHSHQHCTHTSPLQSHITTALTHHHCTHTSPLHAHITTARTHHHCTHTSPLHSHHHCSHTSPLHSYITTARTHHHCTHTSPLHLHITTALIPSSAVHHFTCKAFTLCH